MLSRYQLSPERDRDWLLAWSYDGGLWLSFDDEPAERRPISPTELVYDADYHGVFALPKDAKPGKHTLGLGDASEVVVVVKPPARKKATIQPGLSADNIQAAIASGKRDITLAAGEHIFTRSVVLPDDTVIRGYGATIRGTEAIAGAGGHRPVFVVGKNISIYGVTFTHEQSTSIMLRGPMVPTGLVLADCTFRRCMMGFFFTDALVRDCRFESAGAGIAAGGLWLRCAFTGPPYVHAWSHGTGLGAVAMVDCVFEGTDRGPIFQADGGSIDDFLSVGLRCSNISQTPNGNEIFLCEPGSTAFRRATILHTRISGCQSMALQMDGQSSQCLVRDFFMDGGGGICLWGNVRDWIVQDFELRNGAGIYCGPNCTGVRFIDGSIVDWRPGRINQAWQNPSPLGYQRTIAAWSEGEGNRLERVMLANATMRGFEVQGV